MSGRGEQWTPQSVPGPATTLKETNDAAPCERERGTGPDGEPSAEVIALPPSTLTATTGRSACEVCGKGLLRDQSVRPHRRGHAHRDGLRPPRHGGDGRRGYVCPEEASCARHDDPGRAPRDLAGTGSHYRRRHGERKWKCDLCGRRYAADFDWEAHAMVCGPRERRCGCGAVFSRKDSFATHREFCDAMARQPTNVATVASALRRLALPSQLPS